MEPKHKYTIGRFQKLNQTFQFKPKPKPVKILIVPKCGYKIYKVLIFFEGTNF